MTLSEPLELTESTIESNISIVFEKFNPLFIQQSKRPSFQNKTIYFEISKSSIGFTYPYPEKLMHIISLAEKSEYTILPCNNDIASVRCTNKCELTKAHLLFTTLKRNECLYRMARIHWIPEIINLSNEKDPRVKVWVQEKKNKRNKKVRKTFIRYQEDIIDYLIILSHKEKSGEIENYIFDSAFPVFLTRSKKQYDEQYKRYIESMQKSQ